MSLEQNKELVRRYEEEVHNQKKLDVIDEIVAPEYTHHGANGTETFTREELKEFFRASYVAVPDLRDEIRDIVAEGDKVMVRLTRSGTFEGKWGEVEPTGNYLSAEGYHLARIEDGMIAELWYLFDTVAEEKWSGTYGKE